MRTTDGGVCVLGIFGAGLIPTWKRHSPQSPPSDPIGLGATELLLKASKQICMYILLSLTLGEAETARERLVLRS